MSRFLIPAQLKTTTAQRPSRQRPETRRGGDDAAKGIFLPQAPQGAGGEEEGEMCGEASLVSLLCSPHKTCAKSELFLPAFAFPHKLALILLLALICCEGTHCLPPTLLYTLLCFLPQCSRFCSKPVIAHRRASRPHGWLPRTACPTAATSPFPAAHSGLLSALTFHFPPL